MATKSRDPKEGKKPSKSRQKAPGVESRLLPHADHAENQGAGRLRGLAAVITCGDSGIGRAVAIALARQGADVAIGYFAEKEEDDAKETFRWVEKAGGKPFKQFSRLDILVNNAAIRRAIHVFTRSLAASLAEKGIRVNCVAPVWTPLIPATLDREHARRFGKDTFWQRPAQPAEIAPSPSSSRRPTAATTAATSSRRPAARRRVRVLWWRSSKRRR